MAGTFNYKRYVNFKESDFISDPYFQDCVRSSDNDNKYWSTFLEIYPHKKDDIENARAFLRNLSFKQELPDEQLIQRSLSTQDRKSTRLNSSHANISYAVFCL